MLIFIFTTEKIAFAKCIHTILKVDSNAFDFIMNVGSFTSKLSKVADTFGHDGNGIFDQMAAKDEYLRTDSLRVTVAPTTTTARPNGRDGAHNDSATGNDSAEFPPSIDIAEESTSSTSAKAIADNSSSGKSKHLLSIVAALVAEDEQGSASVPAVIPSNSREKNNTGSAQGVIEKRICQQTERKDVPHEGRLAFDFRGDDDDHSVEEDDFILDIVRGKKSASLTITDQKEILRNAGGAEVNVQLGSCNHGENKITEANYVADIESVGNIKPNKKINILDIVGSSIASRWNGIKKDIPFQLSKGESGGVNEESCSSTYAMSSTSASATGQSEDVNISVVSASCLLEEDLAELERFTQESRKNKMWKTLLKLFGHRHFLFIAFTVVLGWVAYFWGRKNVEDDGVD